MNVLPAYPNYSLPNLDFGFNDIYQLPVVNTYEPYQYQAPVIAPVVSYDEPDSVLNVQTVQQQQPVIETRTIKFTVSDKTGTIPGANIAINGISTAQADANGFVILPNVTINSVIKITFIGYTDYVALASEIPTKVILQEGVTELPEIIITTTANKKPASNTWAWLLLGAVVAGGIYKYSKTGANIVKVKL